MTDKKIISPGGLIILIFSGTMCILSLFLWNNDEEWHVPTESDIKYSTGTYIRGQVVEDERGVRHNIACSPFPMRHAISCIQDADLVGNVVTVGYFVPQAGAGNDADGVLVSLSSNGRDIVDRHDRLVFLQKLKNIYYKYEKKIHIPFYISSYFSNYVIFIFMQYYKIF